MVLRTVTTTALRASWVAASKQVHPDKCQLTDATTAMQKANKAWETLRSKRDAVDKALLTAAVARRDSAAATRRAEEATLRNAAESKQNNRKRAGAAGAKGPEQGKQPPTDNSNTGQPTKKAKPTTEFCNGASSSTEPPSKKQKAAAEPAEAVSSSAKCDTATKEEKVGRYAIKNQKGCYSIKSWGNSTRKFKFEDWHSAPVAFAVAKAFAQAATDVVFKFDQRKKKKEKLEMLQFHGIEVEAKTTMYEMTELLEEARPIFYLWSSRKGYKHCSSFPGFALWVHSEMSTLGLALPYIEGEGS